MQQPFAISITREFGSLGRPIAKRMAEMLQVEYYDRELLELTAQKMQQPVSVISELEEVAKNPFFSMKFPLGEGGTAKQRELFEVQKSIILSIAGRESCIVVGRCSDYILKDTANHFSIFIYAPYAQRYQNCVQQLHLAPQEARDMIREVDKARNNYHRTFAGYLPADPINKDILINSTTLEVEGTAEILVEMIQKKFG